MPKSTFVLTLKLNTEKYQEDILNKRLDIGRQIYNSCLNELFKRYQTMKQSKIYQKTLKMKKSKEKLRVGVVGTGYLGKFHAEKYARMDDVDLVGIVDINKSQAEKIAKKYSVKAYASHKDILDKVDAASIVVPTPAHFKVSRDFLKHNVDVLIEKPITTTIEEADELIGLAESKGLIIQVGHLERFNPVVVALREYVKKPVFIDPEKCSNCGLCFEKCPEEGAVTKGFSKNHAPFYAIAGEKCLYLKDQSCTVCREACPEGAIDLDAVEMEASAIEREGCENGEQDTEDDGAAASCKWVHE